MTPLPKKYEWLNTIGALPKLVVAALSYLGLKEFPGPTNNPVIMNMAKDIGVNNIYTDDSLQAWCALFMCYLCKICGKPMPYKSYDALRAKSFATWGNAVPKGEEKLGDMVVLKRTDGHHVFILLAKTPEGNFIGIGGNQSNSVSIAEFEKSRVIAVRRFYATMAPPSVKEYIVDSEGVISTNEA